MLIGTNFGFFIKNNSLEETLKKTAKAGFNAVDFSLAREYGIPKEREKEYFTGIKELCKDIGLTISQAHSYFLRTDNSPEYFLGKEYFELQLRSIRCASYLGVKWLVFHPFTRGVPEGTRNVYDAAESKREFDLNFKFFDALAPYLKEYGVNGAIENLAELDYTPNPVHCPCFGSSSKELNAIVDALNVKHGDIFGACFDAGHANLIAGESLGNFVRSLGKRLKVLHLHDNFGVLTCWGGGLDRHLPPCFGELDWKDLITALKEIGFNGSFSFEIGNFYPTDEFAQIMARYVYSVGEYLISAY